MHKFKIKSKGRKRINIMNCSNNVCSAYKHSMNKKLSYRLQTTWRQAVTLYNSIASSYYVKISI